MELTDMEKLIMIQLMIELMELIMIQLMIEWWNLSWSN